MSISHRILKLENMTKKEKNRASKQFIFENWNATELARLINSWPNYPPDLAKKFDLTGWDDIDNLSGADLLESITRKANSLQELGIDVEGLLHRVEALSI